MGNISLIEHCFHDAINRWFEEQCDIGSAQKVQCPQNINTSIGDRPLKSQLTESNIVHLVVVPCRAKLDILMVVRIPES